MQTFAPVALTHSRMTASSAQLGRRTHKLCRPMAASSGRPSFWTSPEFGGIFRERTNERATEEPPISFPLQRIAHLGACGKTRVVPQNLWAEAKPAEMRNAKCVCCCQSERRWTGPLVDHLRLLRIAAPNGCKRPRIGADHVNPLTTTVFDLPDHLAAKADPTLIAGDEKHFGDIAECLEQSIAELSDRLAAARLAPGGKGQVAMERDMQIHRLTARLRTLRRYGVDLCLGHMVGADNPEPVYVGRLGLTDNAGRQLLIDWRSPAAEPFFGATHAKPMGLVSRRRYRWARGRINDYWDEVFTTDGLETRAALDDQSAFIASLGSSRSTQMRDVLGTIAAEQD